MALAKLYSAPDKYSQLLAEELSIAGNGKKASLQLTTAAKVEPIQQSMTILDQGIGREKVLVYMSNEGDTPEEVILTIQGYLLKAKMPPITHESDIARTKVLHTEQYLRITGLGNAQFGQAAVAMISMVGNRPLAAYMLWDIYTGDAHLLGHSATMFGLPTHITSDVGTRLRLEATCPSHCVVSCATRRSGYVTKGYETVRRAQL
ncbi:hypothetical protein FOMPIDRAFT_1053586 [Fomitopsis schrenkii]|uniref:Uncharacterized protein n=1 Tax=Fomitopsis schrenkii TaxID=2126942 RepID=S8F2W1_FOMSC|nr:hypothetical protein FOMPIDRAFT_1053586 [Fomitopsis schrenkii]